MDLRSNIKKYLPLIGFILIMGFVLTGWILYFPTIPERIPRTAQKKAIILCSANDFYGSEDDDFNDGNDSKLDQDTSLGNWTFAQYDGGTDGYHDNTYGHPSNLQAGSIFLDWSAGGPGFQNATFVLDWNANYELVNYALYNLSVWIEIQGANFTDGGAHAGIRWKNSMGDAVRTDWSNNISLSDGQWHLVNVASVCNNETDNEITTMELILAAEGNFLDAHSVYFDEIKVDRWIQINLTDPTDPPPPPPGKDSDGFPAQALHVYWILKDNGYTDNNIFLMLYHTGDDVIDIDANDIYTNDLNRSGVLAEIDVENDNVNASRFKQELDVSSSGSFASSLHAMDQLIIFMTDHGSNAVLPDKNATFHFEADNSYINETEFYELVKEIPCSRMLICVDSCFSGNFLNEDSNIGQSWYDLPNCILISAASNVLSWYWINNKNPDGFAGSWFFHPFWEQLDLNQTILSAYNFALGFIPSINLPRPVAIIQNPLIKDNLGINNTWSFDSDPQL